MKTFQTHDLYLSSALKICGFRLLDLKKDEKGRGIFVFQDRDDRPQIVRSYFSGDLTGSLKAFSNAWADLKSLINEI
jgi:5S rRNA maturation endonuclease (ribonuclease M5)